MERPAVISDAERAFVVAMRRAILATESPEGRARLVPVCFVLMNEVDALGRALVYTPIDEKPKQSPDPRTLARVRDLLVLPAATLVVDRWEEDWSRLGWVRLYGRGELLEPEPREVEEHAAAVAALRAKYPQYADHALDDRPVIKVAVDRVVSWGNLEV
jgi:PPOX class probable F420-dependent enzyme